MTPQVRVNSICVDSEVSKHEKKNRRHRKLWILKVICITWIQHKFVFISKTATYTISRLLLPTNYITLIHYNYS